MTAPLREATGFTIIFKSADGETAGTINSTEEGIYMTNKPDIILPELQVDAIEILGRNSTITYNYGCYRDRQITLNLVAKDYNSFNKLLRFIGLFNGVSSTGTIEFNYMRYLPNTVNLAYCYRFKPGIIYTTRDAKGIPEVDLQLTLEPFAYATQKKFVTTTGDFWCESEVETPFLLNIQGAGDIWINGEKITVTESLILDTELMIAYTRENNIYTNKGTKCKCNMTKLKLKPQKNNTITKSSGITSFSLSYWPTFFR